MMQEKITNAVAATGVGSVPAAVWWVPSLDQMSKVLAIVYTMLGILWLARQIWRSFTR